LDYLRNKYLIRTGFFDEDTIEKISEKSSLSTGKIKYILKEIEKVNHSQKITEVELININYQIEKFYERTK